LRPLHIPLDDGEVALGVVGQTAILLQGLGEAVSGGAEGAEGIAGFVGDAHRQLPQCRQFLRLHQLLLPLLFGGDVVQDENRFVGIGAAQGRNEPFCAPTACG
jgi:hypothetical protein